MDQGNRRVEEIHVVQTSVEPEQAESPQRYPGALGIQAHGDSRQGNGYLDWVLLIWNVTRGLAELRFPEALRKVHCAGERKEARVNT